MAEQAFPEALDNFSVDSLPTHFPEAQDIADEHASPAVQDTLAELSVEHFHHTYSGTHLLTTILQALTDTAHLACTGLIAALAAFQVRAVHMTSLACYSVSCTLLFLGHSLGLLGCLLDRIKHTVIIHVVGFADYVLTVMVGPAFFATHPRKL